MTKKVESVALLELCKGLDNSSIIEELPASVEDLKKLSALIFSFNDPGVTSLFIGYICALFLKERLWKELGCKFPHMALIGASGSGKSQTMESIGIPILNMTLDQQLAAKQATPFTTLKLASSSNTVPFIINEYKQHKLPQYRIDEIDNLLNNCYDRYRGDRGQANQTIRTYQYSSPVILIGEAFNADTSAVERIIRIYLNRDESMKYTESFLKLKGLTFGLRRLGKRLLIESMGLNTQIIQQWHDSGMKLLEKTSIKTSRGTENIVKILCGLDLLQLVYKKSSLNFSDEKVKYLKSQAIERYQADTLEGNTSSKSAVGEILEAIDQLAYKQAIFNERHYKILDRSGELALDIKSIYEVLERETVSRKNILPLSQAEFTRLLRKESFFSSYKTVVLVPPGSIEDVKKPRGSFVLSIHGLRESGIDLGAILGDETSFQQLEWGCL